MGGPQDSNLEQVIWGMFFGLLFLWKGVRAANWGGSPFFLFGEGWKKKKDLGVLVFLAFLVILKQTPEKAPPQRLPRTPYL